MRALLIEDDTQAGKDLCRALKTAEFNVDWVRDGRAGRSAIDAAYYAIVLLDLGLPDTTGLAVLRALRAAGNSVPVLILSAPDDLDARVCGLESGADDCVLKPLDVRELLARIRAVLRRRAGYATSAIGDASLNLDLEKRTLNRHGVASSLSAREFALMHAFLEKPGMILSRGQLEDRLYGWGREVESNAVDVLIHSMRKKFGQSLIRNVRGLGWTIAQANA
ncbi:response regulator transcription factor [Burkholderia sp. Ac-20365]|jgi:two-component system OmpR family response regulator|uniref:response regulator transcription factor n=1 Tax=Burkholderia sp. Ac-20365 TaxID=2703897 RepID=UPI00197C4FC7|nr:response regulator transcription factor [Burkholderia sp. Ac-20365]MBN3765228.1 response regulator transcription factor [Burkholderia sp. Ac-20365]